jgi:hypothetical protein
MSTLGGILSCQMTFIFQKGIVLNPNQREMEIIKDNLNNIVATDRLTGREETEFLEKLK